MAQSAGDIAFRATLQAAAAKTRSRTTFFLAMSLLMLLLVLLGFGPTLFLRPFFDAPPIPLYLYLHGAALTAWYVWFAVQTAYIVANRPREHRRLGVTGVSIGAIALVASVITTLRFPPRFVALTGREVDAEYQFLAEIVWLNASVLICFLVFLSAAVAARRRPQAHKRFMLLASLSFIPPALTRIIDWPVWGLGNNAYFPLLLCLVALIAALAVHDFLSRRSIHPVTAIGGAGLAVSFALGTFLMPQTELGRTAFYLLYNL